MPKTKEQKKESIKLLKERLENAKGAVFSSFSNISVKDQEDMRTKLREAEIEYSIFKKTLVKKVLDQKKLGSSEIDEWFGNIGVAASQNDEIVSAKIIAQLAEDLEGLEIKAGILEGKLIDKCKVLALSKLLGKDELIAKLVGSIRAPLSGLVNMLSGNQRALLTVLNQIKK